jgi:alpha-glucosidase
VELRDGGEEVLAFRRGPLTVVLNCGEKPVELPAGEVLHRSGPLANGLLPPDTAAWLA